MAKLIRVSDSKAFRVEPVSINGENFISIRQMYSTKSDPTLKPAKQGVTLPLEEAIRIAKAVRGYATSEDTQFKVIEVKGRSKE